MSAMLRTSGRFFAAHIANILTGEATAAIRRHTHDMPATFGAGRERNAPEWRSIFRQLHAAELIARDLEEDRWSVTPQGRRVLRGEDTIALRAPAAGKRAESMAVPGVPAARSAPLSTGEASLFAALKAKRLELAQAERVPAYVVFPDRTLLDMAAKRPRSAAAMALVHGVGEAKLAKYGAIFLDSSPAMRTACAELHRLRPVVSTHDLIRKVCAFSGSC